MFGSRFKSPGVDVRSRLVEEAVWREAEWTYLAKDAKEGDPENEEDQAPGPHKGGAHDEGNAEEDGAQGREAGDDLGVDPAAVRVDVRLAGAVDVDAIEAGDGDGEQELEEVQDHKGKVAQRHA